MRKLEAAIIIRYDAAISRQVAAVAVAFYYLATSKKPATFFEKMAQWHLECFVQSFFTSFLGGALETSGAS